MDIHYNAFISYRHHPDDIKVAVDIHRGLERFRIPKGLRKKVSAISRIFRDKEELPITSSLTDTIYRALENSDFLIVICSVHTRESIWVQREIETFLKTHHRSRVLTVLASGEPYDVIPEILLHEDVTDPETGETRRIDYEPLSCDWRLKRRQAVREELPRLAAALLGCGYDELRQRQRQYRLKRTAILLGTAAVAAVGLAAYFLYTSLQIKKANDGLQAANQEISRKNQELNTANTQIMEQNDQIREQNDQLEDANVRITENLEQALRNQSRYLAGAAQERLAEGDRLTAMSLALAGLPKTDERPYEPAAEFSLSQALAAYQADQKLQALAAFESETMVTGFVVADDGRSMFMVDARDVITGWDTVSFKQLCTIDAAAHDPQGLFMTPQGNVAFRSNLGEKALCCYSPAGELLWSCPGVLSAAWVGDHSDLAVLQTLDSKLYRLMLLDPVTGSPRSEGTAWERTGDGLTPSRFLRNAFPAGQPLALGCTGSGIIGLARMDPVTGAVTELARHPSSSMLLTASVTETGRVLAMVSDGSGDFNGDYGTFQITGPARRELYCYEADGTLLWQTEMLCHTYTNLHNFLPVPGQNMVLAQSGDTFQLLDPETGAILSQFQTGGQPISLDLDGTGIWGMLKSGADYNYAFRNGLCYTTPFRDGAVDIGTINRGYYAVEPLGSQVVLYRTIRDESGTPVEGSSGATSVTARAVSGDHMALFYGSNLFSLDLARGTQNWKINIGYSTKLLGIRDGAIWIWRTTGNTVERYDLITGEKQEQALDLKKEGVIGNMSLDSNPWLTETGLWFLCEARGHLELRRYTPETGTEIAADLSSFQGANPGVYSKETTLVHGDSGSVWLWRGGALYRTDIRSGLTRLITDCESVPALAIRESDGLLALCSGTEVIFADPSGSLKSRLTLATKGVSLYFWEDCLLALCDDACLYRYSMEGTQLSRTGLQVYNTFSSNVTYPGEDPLRISWNRTEGDLVLGVFGAGNLIETESWQVRAYIPNLTGSSPDGSAVYVRSSGQLYRYPLCTTAQIMERARETLGSFTLTEAQRRSYGID